MSGSNAGVRAHNWLGTADTALACVIVVAIWKEAGFCMIFYLAAMQQISAEHRRSFRAGRCLAPEFFRRVRFPLLMPTTLFVLVNVVINAFRSVQRKAAAFVRWHEPDDARVSRPDL